ncbi:MAG: polyprenyl synthetase family protein [Nannocystaceae bacterium]
MTDPELAAYLGSRRQEIDIALERFLPRPPHRPEPGRAVGLDAIAAGMRYAALQGGKRMRPILALAACEAAGGTTTQAMPAACALEMIHAYSLVHDDLPAMDDDAERRGQPTVHVAFGEAIAVLVGDALLTGAFQAVTTTRNDVSAQAMLECVRIMAHHAGFMGMVGGQGLDLAWGQRIDNLKHLERLHALKTGGLYAAAGAMGGLCSGESSDTVGRLEAYGLAFGIAFQHADDVLDDDQLDLRPQAQARVDVLARECNEIAHGFGERGHRLAAIADWVRARAHL